MKFKNMKNLYNIFRKKKQKNSIDIKRAITTDFRMCLSNKEEALKFIKECKGSWVYIKYSYQSENSVGGVYTKIKIRYIEEHDDIYIYGEEDEDRLVIVWSEVSQIEKTYSGDEILIRAPYLYIYIKKYQPLANVLNELPNIDRHMVITEGKTDWKLIKAALESYQKEGKYTNLDISFLEYEDELAMGEDKLLKVRDYNSIFHNSKLRIFVFDADVSRINQEHVGSEYKSLGNNVYSFVLPIPEGRKNTPLISIENYFTDEEIKTFDSNGRRLYMSGEFDNETGRHTFNKEIITLSSKNDPNHIIDNKVYHIDNMEINRKNVFKYQTKNNIALSKNDFAQNVLSKVEDFGKIKFDNFSLILDVIERIMNEYYVSNYSCMEISQGVYLEKGNDGFESVYIRVGLPNYDAHVLKKNGMIGQEIECEDDKFILNLYIETEVGDSIKIPISIMYSDKLFSFFDKKIKNRYNRIYLQVFDEKREQTKSCELLSGEEANLLIERVMSNNQSYKKNTNMVL